jgi:type II secretory pathway pseudopilin PulG
MNSDTPISTTPQARRRHHGLTLVEILVSMTIAIVLMSLVLFTGKTVRQSRLRAAAEQQMALIAAAIEQYAAFWPKWEVVDGNQKVVVADKGWPDFIPGRLFDPYAPSNPFTQVSGFNDHLSFDATAIYYDPGLQSFGDPSNPALTGDVLNANASLAYCLTSASGKGPYVSDKSGSSVLVDIATIHKQAGTATYPHVGATAATRLQVFVDPWGTPYRYFWVYRDPTTDPALKAYKGVLPVDYGAFMGGTGAGGVGNPLFFNSLGAPKKAVSFVIESAGPDKKFGNVWKANPTSRELNDASDNLTIMP